MPLDACPKEMTFGPCGGVAPDGACEVPGTTCPFAPRDDLVWDAPKAPAKSVSVPDVLVDLRPDLDRPDETDAAARTLVAAGVGALIGDHVDDPTPQGAAGAARALRGTGLDAVVTLTCRDRSAPELTSTISQLLDDGVRAVHCVTGDHPRARLGSARPVRFALDSFELVSLARSLGAPVSVAESPAAPPTGKRPERLAAKAHAGASMAILNHAGSVEQLTAFARACHQLAPDLALVAPVPVITDHRSADALDRFPGLVLPPGLADRILASADPHAEGCAAAIELGCALHDSGHFAALNLSGPGTGAPLPRRATLMADIATSIRSTRRRAPDLTGGRP